MRRPASGTKPQRAVAFLGIIGGLLSGVVLGIVALLSYRAWQRGESPRPAFAWFIGFASLGAVVSSFVTGLFGLAWEDSVPVIIGASLIGGVIGSLLFVRRSQ